MDNPSSFNLPYSNITDCSPYDVAMVLDAVLGELDVARIYSAGENYEARIDRLELAVLTLATAIKNGTIGERD